MNQFKDEQFITAADKEKILKIWIRFLKNGLRHDDFTRALYTYLMNYCDFIAHYDISGFIDEYFTTGADKIRFLEQFDDGQIKTNQWISYKLRGSAADLNRAMMDEAAKFLPVLYAAARAEQKETDLKIVQMLLAKHNLELDSAVRPASRAIAAGIPAQQNLFS